MGCYGALHLQAAREESLSFDSPFANIALQRWNDGEIMAEAVQIFWHLVKALHNDEEEFKVSHKLFHGVQSGLHCGHMSERLKHVGSQKPSEHQLQ